jgi:hypothetical protein
MGLNFMDITPIPHLTSSLKGEEQNKLAHMRMSRSGIQDGNAMCHK